MTKTPVMRVAHDARVIAQEMIRTDHPHLLDAQIVYVFTDQKRKRCDRVRLGSAAKLSSVQRFLASGMDSVQDGPDFLILIDSNEWAELSPTQRKGLVDHELSHCALFVKDEDGWRRWTREDGGNPDAYDDRRWGLRGHDIEEFAGVLARHGWWKADPAEASFKLIALQLALPKNGTAKSSRKPASVGAGEQDDEGEATE